MVYLYSAGVSDLCRRIVRILSTSSRSLRFAGFQFKVGESQAPRYLSGVCGDVIEEGWTVVEPFGCRTVMGADLKCRPPVYA